MKGAQEVLQALMELSESERKNSKKKLCWSFESSKEDFSCKFILINAIAKLSLICKSFNEKECGAL